VKVRSFFARLRRAITFRRIRLAALIFLLALSGYLVYLDHVVRNQFEGKRFALPARVYARPLELFAGLKLKQDQLVSELKLSRYESDPSLKAPGEYYSGGHVVELVTRPFVYWDGAQPAHALRVKFKGDHIVSLRDDMTNKNIDLVRVDPVAIGGIYPAHNEDRVLVRLDQVPGFVIEALVAVEDRKFYTHHGVDPRGIARALYTMLRGGRIEGGSTLTQQLVKNFFLTPRRTLWRKFNEILMALLLELHYSKKDILETYINEVYLGQDGNRAIHGFGLASQFWFNRPVEQLQLHQGALLVGMLKGPTYYDPRRHPQRALDRRNLVLAELYHQNLITEQRYLEAKSKPLDVSDKPGQGTSPHPAFLEMVHRQLRRDYYDQDLRSEGLRIFTTMDPVVQQVAEQTLKRRLGAIERARRLKDNTLQGAIVVTNSQNGEVQAVVGDRDPKFEGFNRALDAERQIGSLFKPAVYLTALEHPDQYTLITPLDDSKLVWKQNGRPDWSPENYDRKYHGEVPLREALADSFNVATARLGLNLGVDQIIETADQLGVQKDLPPYSSTLLGAVGMTPVQVAQMYQTIASGGFHMPLRTIREVLTADGKQLQRYDLAVKQVVPPGPIYLLTNAMQEVVRNGTAKHLRNYVPEDVQVAGKTGTTDELRDSWFAGFTGDRLAVVWVGNDENQTTHLTGSSGAMTVWGAMMARLDPDPLKLARPDDVKMVMIDPETGLRADDNCAKAEEIPFIVGSAPKEKAPCAEGDSGGGIGNWFKRLFGGK
jgi:penicillin-binding protein 1B